MRTGFVAADVLPVVFARVIVERGDCDDIHRIWMLGPSLIVYELLLYSVQANTDWLRGLFVILALDSRLWCE